MKNILLVVLLIFSSGVFAETLNLDDLEAKTTEIVYQLPLNVRKDCKRREMRPNIYVKYYTFTCGLNFKIPEKPSKIPFVKKSFWDRGAKDDGSKFWRLSSYYTVTSESFGSDFDVEISEEDELSVIRLKVEAKKNFKDPETGQWREETLNEVYDRLESFLDSSIRSTHNQFFIELRYTKREAKHLFTPGNF